MWNDFATVTCGLNAKLLLLDMRPLIQLLGHSTSAKSFWSYSNINRDHYFPNAICIVCIISPFLRLWKTWTWSVQLQWKSMKFNEISFCTLTSSPLEIWYTWKVKLIFDQIKERFGDAGKIKPMNLTKSLQCVSVCWSSEYEDFPPCFFLSITF